MAKNITVGKVMLIILATIGTIVLLGAAGMFAMHSTMMGGSVSHGLWTSMVSTCRGMMGGQF